MASSSSKSPVVILIVVAAAVVLGLIVWRLMRGGAAQAPTAQQPTKVVSLLGEAAPPSPPATVTTTPRGQPVRSPSVSLKKAFVRRDEAEIAFWTRKLVETDPRSAVAILDELAETWRISQKLDGRVGVLFNALLGSWIEEDEAVAADWLRTLPAHHQRHGLVTTARRLVVDDPAGASIWLTRFPAGRIRDQAVNAVVNTLKHKDFGRALDFLMEMPASAAVDRELKELASHTTSLSNGLFSAMATIEMMSDKAQRRKSSLTLVKVWMPRDPDAVAEWIESLPLDPSVNDVVFTAARDWGFQSLDDAVYWVDNIRDAGHRQQGLAGLVHAMAGKDLDRALTIAERMEEGAGREKALSIVIARWAEQDAAAVSEWLLEQGKSRSRDVAIRSFAGAIMKADPSAALQWAETIEDEKIRLEAAYMPAIQWIQRDEEAARAWILKSRLPEGFKKNFSPER